MDDKKNIICISVGCFILLVLLLTLSLTKFSLRQNDIKEIEKFKKNFKATIVVNNDNDYRNDLGFKLDSKENVKLATDSISNLVLNTEKINYVYLLSILNTGNINSNFHIDSGVCFKKTYLENKAKEYFNNIDINFDGLVNLTNYYCSKGIGNFGGSRPVYDSMIEDKKNLTLIYKKYNEAENTLQSTIHYNFVLKNGLYKFDGVNVFNN